MQFCSSAKEKILCATRNLPIAKIRRNKGSEFPQNDFFFTWVVTAFTSLLCRETLRLWKQIYRLLRFFKAGESSLFLIMLSTSFWHYLVKQALFSHFFC